MRIQESIVIQRPLAEVFAMVSNLENSPRWESGVADVKKTSVGPLGVGTTFRVVGKMMGVRMVVDVEEIAFEPDKHFAFKTISGPLPLETHYFFQSVEGGTQVTAIRGPQLRGLFKLFEPLLMNYGQRQLDGDMRKMKRVLEGGEQER